ncbi:hypothetical protein JVU11DRAFT_11297 [Chiua virens]|nr:hypothetical protein JVU11DRAFT_11297 [Chiua virens]
MQLHCVGDVGTRAGERTDVGSERDGGVAATVVPGHGHENGPMDSGTIDLGGPTAQAAHGSDVVKIIAGKLFDPYTLTLLENQVIRVSRATGRVLDVSPHAACDDNEGEVIDLSELTVLPGFVDVHVHLFLHAYSETPWEDQLTKESLAERTIRATVHAKRTLLAGFTTVRDLGTEGAADADIALRKCLSRTTAHTDAMIPGPRYFCASRAIVPTGSYGPKGDINVHKEGIDGITGADVADGPDDCIKAVRRQIGAGADWIKIYADYRFRSRVAGVSAETGRASMNTFREEELKAMVDTAHMYGVKVAAHATNGQTIATLLALGVDSIEHGFDILSPSTAVDMDMATDDASDSAGAGPGRSCRVLRALAHSNAKWVPTLATYYTLSQGSGDAGPWTRAAEAFRAALEEGMDNIACGGDTGVFSHGENALEMMLMVRLGADWKKVLRWGTLGGWECVRSMGWEGRRGAARLARVGDSQGWGGENEVPFGAIRRGFAADVIATCGDVEGNFESAVSAESVRFVMKAGRVYKRDGKVVE